MAYIAVNMLPVLASMKAGTGLPTEICGSTVIPLSLKILPILNGPAGPSLWHGSLNML